VKQLARLQQLFPAAFSGGELDFDVLRQLLGAEEPFGLRWPGKQQARQLALDPPRARLVPVRADSLRWASTANWMIEGDNLPALQLLQRELRGQVKLIYIDPPYNTGRDFVYADRWGDAHAAWLSMMYPRLMLARELLRDDGLMVVSIDDGEAASLRLMLNELFGEENFVASIAWEKRYTRSNNARLFYSLKDTLLVYRRSPAVSQLREAHPSRTRALYANPDRDPRGDWTSSSYVNPATRAQRPNLVYPIVNPFTGVRVEHPTHAWKYARAEHQRHVAEGRLWWASDGAAKFPRLKSFWSEREAGGVVPTDLWDHRSTGTTDEGGAELKALFGEAVFDNPKPTRLIRRLLKLAGSRSAEPEIILDFFAGSGTTGHAVWAQSAEDGLPRRFVLVQRPEALDPRRKQQTRAAALCRQLGRPLHLAEVTKERLRRAAELHDAAQLDLGFRVFRVDPAAEQKPRARRARTS
jgi:adenine-specific DNA-methyltransferase